MARKSTLQAMDTVTVAEARDIAEQATDDLYEYIDDTIESSDSEAVTGARQAADRLYGQVDVLIDALDNAHAEIERLRAELDALEPEAYAVAEMVNDLDHALAFGHMDRVADVLASNPYAMLHRNMLQVSLTLN